MTIQDKVNAIYEYAAQHLPNEVWIVYKAPTFAQWEAHVWLIVAYVKVQHRSNVVIRQQRGNKVSVATEVNGIEINSAPFDSVEAAVAYALLTQG